MTTTAVDDQFAPEPIQEIEQKHHDKIVGIIAEKIEAERRPAPHGWKLVPVEPTPEMRVAGKNTIKGADTTFEGILAELAYRSMLAAAPTPPAQAAPSDADVLLDALSNLEHDNYERSYNGSKNREADAALIRAALERHAAHVAAQPSGSCNGMPAYEGPLSAAQAPAADANKLSRLEHLYSIAQAEHEKARSPYWEGQMDAFDIAIQVLDGSYAAMQRESGGGV